MSSVSEELLHFWVEFAKEVSFCRWYCHFNINLLSNLVLDFNILIPADPQEKRQSAVRLVQDTIDWSGTRQGNIVRIKDASTRLQDIVEMTWSDPYNLLACN